MPFPMVLVLGEMQTALFRIWTQITECLSYNNNYYAMSDTIQVCKHAYMYNMYI